MSYVILKIPYILRVKIVSAIALLYPLSRVRVRATAKLSAAFFHDESSITIAGRGNESAIAPQIVT